MSRSLQNVRRSFVAAGLLVATAACAVIPPPNLKAPELSIADFSVSEFSMNQIKFVLSVDAKNSNNWDIPLSDGKIDFSLMGTQIASGVFKDAKVEIPKNSSKAVPIEFTVPTSQLLDTVRKMNLRDLANLTYQVKGSAKWGTGPFSVPFERKGEFSAIKGLGALQNVLRGLRL